MKQTKLTIHIELLQPLLGSLPGNKELLEDHIASKAPTQTNSKEEIASVSESLEKGTTVFARDERGLFLWDYSIRGFIKEAIGILIETGDINGLSKWQHKRAVDSLVFVTPRRIYLFDAQGNQITECKETLERPLRATTLQGDRIAIARSEILPEGTQFDCEITLLQGKEDTKSKLACLGIDDIKAALDYGQFKGLGQWRGGGYGRFTWQEK